MDQQSDREDVDAKESNRRQFGANASNYATSAVHAKGASLDRMVELVDPQSHWHCLDIATAAGHTAFAFAPHVAEVTATDLTEEMVDLAATRADEKQLTNVRTQVADAEELPFGDESFDLVTCRIAPHHFPNQPAFIAEASRVLASGGTFALVDNVVPNNHEVALFCDDWEQRRDPSHVNCLSLDEWIELCRNAGLEVQHSETIEKLMQFSDWVGNVSVPAEIRPQLLADLLHATPAVRHFLRPTGTTALDATFILTEGVVLARKE